MSNPYSSVLADFVQSSNATITKEITKMTCWNKEQLEQMLEDVVNELDLSDEAMEHHGPMGTPPAELVRLVLEEKDKTIRNLKAGMVPVNPRQ